MSIASVVETIGIEGEGIFSLKVTDAQISLEKHDRCQIFSISSPKLERPRVVRLNAIALNT
jgi:hypothetical protein